MNAMIAVDIALIPPKDVSKKVIELNRNGLSPFGEQIPLGIGRLPHITLTMGCLDVSKVELVNERLNGIASKTRPLRLSSIGLNPGDPASLTLLRTSEIFSLHKTVMAATKDIINSDIREGMVLTDPGETVHELTLKYVKAFVKTSAYDFFKPHITIGLGKLKDAVEPFEFIVNELTLCRLGDYCTCRERMSSYSLGK